MRIATSQIITMNLDVINELLNISNINIPLWEH